MSGPRLAGRKPQDARSPLGDQDQKKAPACAARGWRSRPWRPPPGASAPSACRRAPSQLKSPLCGGSLELNNDIPGIDPPGGLSYKFNCNAQVLGYAIVSNRQVDYFSTEVLVLDATSGEATPEQFGCEGAFPSSGFGCRGVANFGNSDHRRVRDRQGPL